MSSFPANMDPARIPEEAWEYEGCSADGLRRHWVYWVDRSAGVFLRRTTNLVEEELLARNRDSLNESHGKRFGDGKVIASIPLNVFYRDFASRLKEGDDDFVKWWLNHDQNRPYRTFRGRV